jgi:hypothetical protein
MNVSSGSQLLINILKWKSPPGSPTAVRLAGPIMGNPCSDLVGFRAIIRLAGGLVDVYAIKTFANAT